MDFKEFKIKVKKAEGKKGPFAVRDSHTAKEFWRWLKKNKWLDLGHPVTEAQAGIIVKEINKALIEELFDKKQITFPHKMGTLEIVRCDLKIKYDKNGKLIIPYMPDWEKTLKLWYEDEEAYQDRVLIRNEQPVAFIINYVKKEAIFPNKIFYEFFPARSLFKKLKTRSSTEGFDAFPNYTKDELY